MRQYAGHFHGRGSEARHTGSWVRGCQWQWEGMRVRWGQHPMAPGRFASRVVYALNFIISIHSSSSLILFKGNKTKQKTLHLYCLCSVVLFLQSHPNWSALMRWTVSAQSSSVEVPTPSPTLTDHLGSAGAQGLLESLPGCPHLLRTKNVIEFGDRAFKEVIKFKWSGS